jgi:iron complex transport system substrate-binding protein
MHHFLIRWLLIGFGLLMAQTSVAEVRLHDAMGRELILNQPAQRIVSLAPHITEILFAAGAGEQTVGAVSYSDYPDAAKDIPRVGSYNKISYESVLALNPDLVIAWRSGNGEDVAQRLASLGLNVYVGEPQTLENVAQSLRDFGQLSGHEAQGEAAAQAFLVKLNSLRKTYSQEARVDVYYQIWNEPMMTMNGEHLISDVIRLCGGHNVFADALPLVPRISVESVVRANPQVIVASGMGLARPEWLDDWRDWLAIDAVRNQQLYFIPPDLLQRHTPRIIQGAEQMCTYLAQARAQMTEQQQ